MRMVVLLPVAGALVVVMVLVARAQHRQLAHRGHDGRMVACRGDGDGDGDPGPGADPVGEGLPFACPPISGELVCRGCAMTLARALLVTGLDYAVHERGSGYVVCWAEDPALPVIGGNRRRLTMFNRREMIAWCGGREPDDPTSHGILIGLPSWAARVVEVGDIVERVESGGFRVAREDGNGS